MRLPGAALLLTLATGPVAADTVDDYVRDQMRRQKIPGLSLCITRDGQVVKAQGYGLANVEHQVPAKTETVYQSGSVGKQFTAAALMMLVEAGKVGLEDPISKYFGGAPDTWKGITVRHLLTHTSGIKDWENTGVLDYRKDYTEGELLKVATTLPPDFPPGTQWSYSNTGYVLLGILAHRVTGSFYGDFLRERVFGPLGMTSTRVISEADIVPNRAGGYTLERGVLKNQEWVSPSLNTTADGSLYLTVLDMAKWSAALDGDRLLSRASLTQMWTPVRLTNGTTHPYGFAFDLEEQRGQPTIEHGGSWQGFRAAIARYPDEKLAVMVLSNLAQAQPEQIAHGIAGVVDPALQLPDPRSPQADPDPKRTAALRAVLLAWGKGEASPRMATSLRAAAERDNASRKSTAEQLEKQTAFAYLAEDDVHTRALERRGEVVARIVHEGLLTFDKAFAYRFYLNAAGQVADFSSEER